MIQAFPSPSMATSPPRSSIWYTKPPPVPEQGGMGATLSLTKPAESTIQRLPDASISAPPVSCSVRGIPPQLYRQSEGGLMAAPELENSAKKLVAELPPP